MEEEDRSDTEDEDNLASRTVVQNLEPLTTTHRIYLRDEMGIVRDGALKQAAVVEILASAVRETQLEMRAGPNGKSQLFRIGILPFRLAVSA